jgi:hypothetical protein
MNSNSALLGGLLNSKPTLSNTFGCSATSVFLLPKRRQRRPRTANRMQTLCYGARGAGMVTVRLFRSEKAAGFIRFDEAKHRMKPEGVLPDDSIDVIRRELEAGRIAGVIGPYRWYRQATPFFPSDPAELRPCDKDERRAKSQISD